MQGKVWGLRYVCVIVCRRSIPCFLVSHHFGAVELRSVLCWFECKSCLIFADSISMLTQMLSPVLAGFVLDADHITEGHRQQLQVNPCDERPRTRVSQERLGPFWDMRPPRVVRTAGHGSGHGAMPPVISFWFQY